MRTSPISRVAPLLLNRREDRRHGLLLPLPRVQRSAWRGGSGKTAAASSGPIDGRVEYGESRGRETLVGVTAPGDARFVVTIDGLVQAEPGSSIRFGLRPVWLYVFDASDQHALGRV
jgi:hypothetical protein